MNGTKAGAQALEIVTAWQQQLQDVAGDPDQVANAAGDASTRAGTAIQALADPDLTGTLLLAIGNGLSQIGSGLAELDRIGCSDDLPSIAAQFGLADSVYFAASALSAAARSLKPDRIGDPDRRGEPGDLPDRLREGAQELAFAGSDLLIAAGSARDEPMTWPQELANPRCPCPCGKQGPAPRFGRRYNEIEKVAPDIEAADRAVRTVGGTLVAQIDILTQLSGVIVALFSLFTCATACGATPRNGVIAGPAPGAITVVNNGIGTYNATTTLTWTMCCWNWCWFFWWDMLAVSETTTLTWNTGIRTNRPVGAGAAAAAAQVAGVAAAAAPPIPSC